MIINSSVSLFYLAALFYGNSKANFMMLCTFFVSSALFLCDN